MAVEELTDYLENGNIRNSVNFPACDMGVCHAASRIAVLHRNIPNMIGQITAILAEEKKHCQSDKQKQGSVRLHSVGSGA